MGYVFALLERYETQVGSRRRFGTTYLSHPQEPIIQQMGYDAVEMIQIPRSRIQCRLVENIVVDNQFYTPVEYIEELSKRLVLWEILRHMQLSRVQV